MLISQFECRFDHFTGTKLEVAPQTVAGQENEDGFACLFTYHHYLPSRMPLMSHSAAADLFIIGSTTLKSNFPFNLFTRAWKRRRQKYSGQMDKNSNSRAVCRKTRREGWKDPFPFNPLQKFLLSVNVIRAISIRHHLIRQGKNEAQNKLWQRNGLRRCASTALLRKARKCEWMGRWQRLCRRIMGLILLCVFCSLSATSIAAN